MKTKIKTKINKSFTIAVSIKLDTDFDIEAESFEEALEKARNLNVKDVVSFDGNYNDGSIEITGVFK